MSLATLTSLSTGQLLSGLVTALVVYQVASGLYSAYLSPLSKYPGPKFRAASFIPQWWSMWNGSIHRDVKAMHDIYGPIVRISPDQLDFVSAQASRDILAHVQGRKQLPRDMQHYGPTGLHGSIILSDDTVHARQRKLLAHAFSASALKEFDPLLSGYFKLMVEKMKLAAQQSDKIDIMRYYNYTTFDILGDLCFGESFGALATGDYNDWISNVFEHVKMSRITQTGFFFPVIGVFIKALFKLVPAVTELKRQHVAFCTDRAIKRMEMKTDRKDFMWYILRHNDERGMTKDEIYLNSRVLIMAGSETTATLTTASTWLMLRNPRTWEKAASEVRAKFKDSSEMTIAAVAQLPYLRAVIEESLRCFPPIAQPMPRRTDAVTTIDGEVIPAGISVGVGQWGANYSESNFEQAERFIPERWLPGSTLNDKKDAMQPFSMGARGCIGKNLAYEEMTSILARVLYHFDLELHDECRNWNTQGAWILWDKPALYVKMIPTNLP